MRGPSSSFELLVLTREDVDVHPLAGSGSLVLGRAPECDVRINDPSVSRRHAVLHLGAELRVEDLGGANGTFVRSAHQSAESGATQGLRRLLGESVTIRLGEPVSLGSAIVVVRRASSDIDRPRAVVDDPTMSAVREEAQLAAQSALSVLLLGETGVGKEVMARAIHGWSPRAKRPFLGLNCAALSETLLESELFGHEKGAFTGANEARRGLLESVEGGTLFLDEVGELPMSIQVKLLRVLEERQVLRVGGRTPTKVDVRFVSATNRDLEAEITRGTFRQDMFFRLNGIALTIPPLRDRVAEILPLARLFVDRAARDLARSEAPVLSPEFCAALERHAWPGNVRELRNVMDRAVALCRGHELTMDLLPAKMLASSAPPKASIPPSAPAERLTEPPPAVAVGESRPIAIPRALAAPRPVSEEPDERERIIRALEACAGNQTQAAARLGISRRTLVSRLEEYNLPRPRKRD